MNNDLIKAMFITNIITYLGIYLIKTFVMWELTNPFQWIIDLPTYDSAHRAAILFTYAFFALINYILNLYRTQK